MAKNYFRYRSRRSVYSRTPVVESICFFIYFLAVFLGVASAPRQFPLIFLRSVVVAVRPSTGYIKRFFSVLAFSSHHNLRRFRDNLRYWMRFFCIADQINLVQDETTGNGLICLSIKRTSQAHSTTRIHCLSKNVNVNVNVNQFF